MSSYYLLSSWSDAQILPIWSIYITPNYRVKLRKVRAILLACNMLDTIINYAMPVEKEQLRYNLVNEHGGVMVCFF